MIIFKDRQTFAAVAVVMTLLLCVSCEKRAGTEKFIGTGTIEDPFQINSVAALKKIGTETKGWTLDAHYQQTVDIVFTDEDGNWTPIGIGDKFPGGYIFTGSYEGNGFTIANLKIDTTNTNPQGLFGYAKGLVKNVGLINCSITSTGKGTGGLAGTNYGTIQNSYVTGNVSGGKNVGGLVGANYGTIQNSYVEGNVSGGNKSGDIEEDRYGTRDISDSGKIGGVVGHNFCGTVENCYVEGNVSGGDNAGGVVGANESGTITNSYATGNVSGGGNTGGVVGHNESGYWGIGTVENSYATGDVSGTHRIGGVVGHNRGAVLNSYAAGNISGRGGSVGGVVGANESGTVENSYATGDVSGRHFVGGVVGSNSFGTVLKSYAKGDVSGSEQVGGVVGYNGFGTVENSYATGNVSGSEQVGGVVGRNEYGTVESCYATGDISGNREVGGIVGRNRSDAIVNNCVALNGIIARIPATPDPSHISGRFGRVFGYWNAYYHDRDTYYEYDYYYEDDDDNDGAPINNFVRRDIKFIDITEEELSAALISDAASVHGEVITSTNWSSSSWWTETAKWDDTVWDLSGIGADSYPQLRKGGGTKTPTVSSAP